MAQTKRSNDWKVSEQTRTNGHGDVVWISTKLTEQQKQLFESETSSNTSAWWASLHTELEEGYRLSLSYDNYSNMFLCTMFTRDATSKNAGKMLTSRSKDIFRSVLMTIWKHVSLYDRRWVAQEERTDDEG